MSRLYAIRFAASAGGDRNTTIRANCFITEGEWVVFLDAGQNKIAAFSSRHVLCVSDEGL